MGLFSKIFTWWDGATIGTLLWSARKGSKVGEDALGNRYYTNRAGDRRWVIYAGNNDASRVPAEWHGWLHHTHADTPDATLPPPRAWQAEPVPNLTGTDGAYRPSGALERGARRATASGDYQPWTPDGA
ncbi:MAG: NADH:ubiquinone oxidoreductase subunit NDUFA12 [Sphingopyxis sp.]|jgi:NADH:ubiquinone oxidoreductase subunit|nr:NADH:ubiquinone oxidoreductase subunit NDUFA12 [Sphingopyxis sp.]